MPRATAYMTNTCTTLALYIDQIEFISVEMKKAFEHIDEIAVGTCAYCGNARPKMFFSGCPLHRACEMCHFVEETVKTKAGKCAVRGCKHTACWPPLRDLVLEGTQKSLKLFEEKAKHGFEIEKTKHDGLKAELRIAKDAKQAAETALANVANAMQVADDAGVPMAAAAPARKRIRDCETEEEKEEMRAERREQQAAAKAKRFKLDNYDQLKKQFDAIVAIGLTPEQEAARARVAPMEAEE